MMVSSMISGIWVSGFYDIVSACFLFSSVLIPLVIWGSFCNYLNG
jgi:hypothetical protein